MIKKHKGCLFSDHTHSHVPTLPIATMYWAIIMLLIIQSFNLYDINILVNMSISSSLFLCGLIIACVANRSSDILYLTHFCGVFKWGMYETRYSYVF